MTSIPQTPHWPGLYDPFLDLLNIPHRDPVQPTGRYLYDADDVFSFTLYWNFIFYLPLFILAGTFAFLNLVFPPQRIRYRERALARDGESESYSKYTSPRQAEHFESHPLVPMTTAGSSVAYSPPAASPSKPAFPTGTGSAPRSGLSESEPTPMAEASSVTPTTSGSRRSPPTPSSKGKSKGIEVVNPHRTRVAFGLIVLFVYLGAGLLGAVVGSAIVGYILAGLFRSGGFFMSTWIPLIFALVQTLIGVLGIYPSVAEII